MMSAVGWRAGVILLAAGSAAVADTGGSERADPALVVDLATWLPDKDGVVLVGSSGQLYRPDEEEKVWRRKHAGGVAVDVRGAFRDGRGGIYVVGRRTPIFQWANGAWHTKHLPNRGSVAAGGAGSHTVIAIGRHIYEPRGRKHWIRRGAARDRVVAVWQGGGSRVYVSEEDGELRRRLSSGWHRVRHALGKGEVVVEFAGTPGKDLYGRTDAGNIVRMRGSRATKATPEAELSGFAPAAMTPSQQGGVWVLGMADGGEGPQPVLVRAVKGRLQREAWLPALGGDDAYRVIVETGDGLLVASRRGRVRVRAEDGSWWKAHVSGELPPGTTRSFEDRAPARAK